MSNRGTFSGVNQGNWRNFTPSQPILVYSASSGTPTQPILGSSTVVAQYRYESVPGKVEYQGYIQFDSTANFGSGDDIWNVLLPVPALREAGAADMPIGNGYVWQGSAGNRNAPLRCVQSDTLYPIGTADGNSNYAEDYYMQFYLQHNIASGTGTISTGTTSTTISHGLNFTPVEFDIQLTFTNNPTVNPGWWWITNCTSTQFTVNCKTNPSTAGMAFSWKVIGEPNGTVANDALVNQKRPFGQWAAGWVLGWNVEYRARR